MLFSLRAELAVKLELSFENWLKSNFTGLLILGTEEKRELEG